MADTTSPLAPPLFADAPTSVSFKKLRKRLVRGALKAIDDYRMVDRRAVARLNMVSSGDRESKPVCGSIVSPQ